MARSGGNPIRPASAVTTPVTVTTVPTDAPLASTIVSVAGGVGPGVGEGEGDGAEVGAGVRVGEGDGLVLGVADGAAVGVAVEVGAGVGLGVGVGAGVTVGVGVGVESTPKSPASVTWIRYPDRPVPELSRCPTGPTAVTVVPLGTLPLPRAAGPTMTRTAPDPSSTMSPSPSASSDGDPTVTPWTSTRRPSTGSPMAPVCWANGSRLPLHREHDDVGQTRSQRPLREPVVERARDADEGVRRQRIDDGGVEVDRDPTGFVLDEALATRLERPEAGRERTLDPDGRPVRAGRAPRGSSWPEAVMPWAPRSALA